MKRWGRAAAWIVPPLLCLAIYRFGLKVWFQQDDFAWLGLSLDIHSPQDFWCALFAPMAQGTIRPWSERLFFIVFHELFGLDALPFRVWVFLTQSANLVLVAWITLRLTGSRLAALLAPILWTANAALAKPMAWTAAYNQILCGFFILLAFHFLLRYLETKKKRYWVLQWLVFLAGFGALELNVVYPALAAAYTLCRAREHFLKTLPMFIPSAAFTLLHQWVTPKVARGPYALHFDADVFSVLAHYWWWAWGFAYAKVFSTDARWTALAAAATVVMIVALVGFVVWKLRARQWLAAFLVLWFLILIAPVLPLRDHFSEYYLTLPVIGLAMLGAWAIDAAWKAGPAWRALALLLTAAYMGVSVPAARHITRQHYERSKAVQRLVLGVVRAHEKHPGKVILLTGVDTEMFWASVIDNPFRLYGVKDVYLVPGSENSIQAFPGLGEVTDFVLPTAATRKALTQYQAVVYSAGGPQLRNVTSAYLAVAETQLKPEYARHVDVAQPLVATQLGPGWYEVEEKHRWMRRRAAVRLGGPRSPHEKLYVTGFAPPGLLKSGPVRLTIAVNGKPYRAVTLARPGELFELEFPLSADLVGAEAVDVTVEVDRVFLDGEDKRELSLTFGTFSMR